MSEEKKTPAKADVAQNAKKNWLQKALHWCKTLPQRIARPFKAMYYELKKVTWPTKEKLINYSVIVLCFMLLMGVIIGLLDMGASAGVRLLIPNSSSSSSSVILDTDTTDTTVEIPVDEGEAEEAVEEAVETAEEAAEEVAETAETAAEEAVDTAVEAVEEAVETGAGD